jgi:peptide/nickel transport system ATP-binding protein
LQAAALTKHFPVRHSRRGAVVHAIDDASLDLWAGEVAAVVGESGSGKSTLARLMARLITPTGGQLKLEGLDAGRLSRQGTRSYRKSVQLVLQDPFASLNPVHSVRYHLVRPLQIHGQAARGPALDAAVAGLLDKVKLTPASQYADKLPHELSGGQRQRVAIARALAPGPKVLLADEPVSMLDVSIRLGILNLLEELRQRDGLAILYITHDIASARYFASTISVMYAGQIVESGPSTAITDRPAHPYTQLLLRAAPDPQRAAPPALIATGSPPSLIDPPSGCRFQPRCPHALPACAAVQPPPVDVGPGQWAACWLHVPAADRPGADSSPAATTPAACSQTAAFPTPHPGPEVHTNGAGSWR